jgi:hypothetical protein
MLIWVFFCFRSIDFYEYNKGQNRGQADLLDYVKRVLRKAYIKTHNISRNGQDVAMLFLDFIERIDSRCITANTIRQSWISTDSLKNMLILREKQIRVIMVIFKASD